ncbi:MAG: enoyl-CoA hydratase-related protein, partial [Pseudomonadota bacterium]
PPSTVLDVNFHNGWLSVWFNQPERRNPLTDAVVADLVAILKNVRDDRSVRGLTLRGRGGVFCSGGDLKAFKSMRSENPSRDAILSMSKNGAELFHRLNEAPQVTIAMVEGAAMAGGFGVACACDVVICDANAKFAMTETRIGLSPAQISPLIIQKLGYATARRLMLTAARFDAKEAHSLGFADFVAEGAPNLEVIERRIRADVLACSPGAIADTKALILKLPSLDVSSTVDAAANVFADRLLSEDGAEGVASFVEKRRPRWHVDEA